jgi:alkylation response protein AidB-like acyl-CoA dehydrogenase
LFAIEDPASKIPAQRVRLNGMNMYEKQFTLFIDDLEVDEDAVVGQPGKGMRALFDGLNPERLMVAAQCCGLGRWGVGKAVDYANQRKVFDDVIGKYQGVQHPLADAFAKIEAAWALTIAACKQYDQGGQAGEESNLAKFVAADAGMQAIEACLQTHGGSGFTEETMILDRYMIIRLQKTAPVSREMALNHIAHKLLGLPRSY